MMVSPILENQHNVFTNTCTSYHSIIGQFDINAIFCYGFSFVN